MGDVGVSSTYRDDSTPAPQKKTPLMQKREMINKAIKKCARKSMLGSIVKRQATLKKRPAALMKRSTASQHKVVMPKKCVSQKKVVKRAAFDLKHS